jgi:Prokaryotic homologs of the JAB domain
MYRYVAFIDDVLDQIEQQIARFPPERGGALLGPVGQPLVTEFVYDQGASTTAVTFTPSPWLADKVGSRESGDPEIELKGMLHSHPGNMGVPSLGDHHAYEDSLVGAPWLGRLVAPIVTVGASRARDPHEIALPSGKMSVYIAERRHDAARGVVVQPAAPHVIDVSRDLNTLARALGGTSEPPFTTDIDGQIYVAGVVGCDGFDLQVILGPAYPFTAPLVIAARRPGANGSRLSEPRLGLVWNDADSPAAQGLPVVWDLAVPDESRLVASVTRRAEQVAPAELPAALPAEQEEEPDSEHEQEHVVQEVAGVVLDAFGHSPFSPVERIPWGKRVLVFFDRLFARRSARGHAAREARADSAAEAIPERVSGDE